MKKALELLGFAGGFVLAPFIAAGSYLRCARVLHPDGIVYRAEVTVDARAGAARAVAERLAGPALVRLSSALFRRTEGRATRPDLLGVAIRFKDDPAVSVVPELGDQDILFATLRSVLTLLPALLTTRTSSFLLDDYYAMGVFDAAELGRVRLRLVSPDIPSGELSREEALEQAVRAGRAVFELEARPARCGSRYQPIAQIRLLEQVHVDQAALRFSPFRTGRRIVPRGFLHALRILPYPASQLARKRCRRDEAD